MRVWDESLLGYIFKTSAYFYRTPSNFNYWYNFGFLSFFFLFFQIFTGIFLAMFYSALISAAFDVTIDVTFEHYFGWFIRSLHANGASFFFICVYIHMARGLYYGSYLYPRQIVWVIGGFMWLFMIAIAFLGYILPWGQMSFWGAMVITNLLGSIPFIGGDLVYLLWGGFTIGNSTLQRFYSLHYTLPFVLLFFTLLHVLYIHEYGSSNPLGISSTVDFVVFTPYFFKKDLLAVLPILCILLHFVFYFPDALGHSDNYIKADALVTPTHIVPEWYFLPLYAVLRSVPNKLFGIFLIFSFIVCIITLPFYNKSIIRSGQFKPLHSFLFWIFIADCVLLGWVGGLPVMSPYIEFGQLFTFLFFFLLLIGFPCINIFERCVYLSICKKNKKIKFNK